MISHIWLVTTLLAGPPSHARGFIRDTCELNQELGTARIVGGDQLPTLALPPRGTGSLPTVVLIDIAEAPSRQRYELSLTDPFPPPRSVVLHGDKETDSSLLPGILDLLQAHGVSEIYVVGNPGRPIVMRNPPITGDLSVPDGVDEQARMLRRDQERRSFPPFGGVEAEPSPDSLLRAVMTARRRFLADQLSCDEASEVLLGVGPINPVSTQTCRSQATAFAEALRACKAPRREAERVEEAYWLATVGARSDSAFLNQTWFATSITHLRAAQGSTWGEVVDSLAENDLSRLATGSHPGR